MARRLASSSSNTLRAALNGQCRRRNLQARSLDPIKVLSQGLPGRTMPTKGRRASRPAASPTSADYLIITALEQERDALLRQLP